MLQWIQPVQVYAIITWNLPFWNPPFFLIRIRPKKVAKLLSRIIHKCKNILIIPALNPRTHLRCVRAPARRVSQATEKNDALVPQCHVFPPEESPGEQALSRKERSDGGVDGKEIEIHGKGRRWERETVPSDDSRAFSLVRSLGRQRKNIHKSDCIDQSLWGIKIGGCQLKHFPLWQAGI